MSIDYKLATKVIDRAMKGIDYLVGGGYDSQRLAFAGPGSSGPTTQLYNTPASNGPNLETYLKDSHNATKPAAKPTEREGLLPPKYS